jgi:predicted DNA-binding transcriptional regulator YafY
MRKLTQQIEMIERIDQLIRLQCTGSPAELAHRLQISKASLYRIIFCMKEMGAPIRFSMTRRSFVYNNDVRFYCGLCNNFKENIEILKRVSKNEISLTYFCCVSLQKPHDNTLFRNLELTWAGLTTTCRAQEDLLTLKIFVL